MHYGEEAGGRVSSGAPVHGLPPASGTRPLNQQAHWSQAGVTEPQNKSRYRCSWGFKLWPCCDKEKLYKDNVEGRTLLPQALCTHVSEMKTQGNKHVLLIPCKLTNYAFFNKCVCVCVSRSVMSNSVIPWTVAHQAPLFMGLSRQEYWRKQPFPSPGDLSKPGIEPGSPELKADSLLPEPSGKPFQQICS